MLPLVHKPARGYVPRSLTQQKVLPNLTRSLQRWLKPPFPKKTKLGRQASTHNRLPPFPALWLTRHQTATLLPLLRGLPELAGVSTQNLPESGEAGTGAHRSPLPRPTAKLNGATGNPPLNLVGTAPHPHCSPVESCSQQLALRQEDSQNHYLGKRLPLYSDPPPAQLSRIGPTISLTRYAERPLNWSGSECLNPPMPADNCVRIFLFFFVLTFLCFVSFQHCTQ